MTSLRRHRARGLLVRARAPLGWAVRVELVQLREVEPARPAPSWAVLASPERPARLEPGARARLERPVSAVQPGTVGLGARGRLAPPRPVQLA